MGCAEEERNGLVVAPPATSGGARRRCSSRRGSYDKGAAPPGSSALTMNVVEATPASALVKSQLRGKGKNSKPAGAPPGRGVAERYKPAGCSSDVKLGSKPFPCGEKLTP